MNNIFKYIIKITKIQSWYDKMELYYSKIENYNKLKDNNNNNNNNLNIFLDKVFSNLNKNINEYNNILIKPNVLGPYPPERNATTHPLFLEWIINYLLNCGVDKNKIIVGDSSGYDTNKSFKVSKLQEVCEKYSIKWLPFEKDETVSLDIMNNNSSEVPLPKCVLNCDLIINLPKLKTHILMKYTGAVKNLYGCIPGGTKPKLHGIYAKEEDFAKFTVELHNKIIENKEIISIIDGIEGMEGDGPSNGKTKKSKIVVGSSIPVLVDIFCGYYIGYKDNDLFINNILKKQNNITNFKINNVNINNGKINTINSNNINTINPIKFKKPTTYFLISIMPPKLVKLVFSFMVQKPKINKRKCRLCKICEHICPVNAIDLSNFKVNEKKCINCYCCHEMCGFDAIKLKRKFI